jgi:hypothetical protein
MLNTNECIMTATAALKPFAMTLIFLVSTHFATVMRWNPKHTTVIVRVAVLTTFLAA